MSDNNGNSLPNDTSEVLVPHILEPIPENEQIGTCEVPVSESPLHPDSENISSKADTESWFDWESRDSTNFKETILNAKLLGGLIYSWVEYLPEILVYFLILALQIGAFSVLHLVDRSLAWMISTVVVVTVVFISLVFVALSIIDYLVRS